MQHSIKLLDCTLRDGGYLNDWEFGHDNLVSIFERLTDAGIDFVELGFLDDRRTFDINRSIMPGTDCMETIYGGLNRHNSTIMGMIDYGTCSLEHIQPASESFLDGIRVIFKKHLREPALKFCAELKKLGYVVFAQLVSVTSYSDDEMKDLIELANEVEPFAISMVDTYGLMHQNNLHHYFELLDGGLKKSITIGYHGHNNFQMAYANSISMMLLDTDRDILVDGTLYGMGKSAGNAPIELLAMWMNENVGKKYSISQLLEAIDSNIMRFYVSPPWGYSMFFYLSASNDCHPNYVQYLLHKRTLSVKSINEILKTLEGEKKLLYDEDYIESLYQKYQMIEINDEGEYEKLAREFGNSKILLLAPGRGIVKQKDRVKGFIKNNNPIIVSINYINDDFTPHYLFLTNSKRYLKLSTKLSKCGESIKIVATSNLTKTTGDFNITLRYGDLVDMETSVIDNPFIMFLKVASKIGIKEIYLAGFDGYVGEKENYYKHDMEYSFNKEVADGINDYVRSHIKKYREKMSITFITDSIYEVV